MKLRWFANTNMNEPGFRTPQSRNFETRFYMTKTKNYFLYETSVIQITKGYIHHGCSIRPII
jgi:hypothetical protein